MASTVLSDKALAVFAFAAYHQFTSGEKVTDVVLHDGAGHAADPDAIKQLQDAELVTVENNRAVFTDAGQNFLGTVLDALRKTAQAG